MNNYVVFDEYKDKIINAIDFQYAESLAQIASTIINDPVEQKLIQSILNKDRYINKMDFEKFLVYLNIIDKIDCRDNAEVLLKDLEILYDDIVQINTLKRIIAKKIKCDIIINKPYYLQVCCPHCG